MIEKIISVAASLAAAAITALLNTVKSKLSERTRVKVEEIAIVVEGLYYGCGAAEKLRAFKEICKNKGLNIKKAVAYLETKIMPISKNINVYGATAQTDKKNNTEVTN